MVEALRKVGAPHHDADEVSDNGVRVASLIDIGAAKLVTIQQRTQARDYEDVLALIDAGVSLTKMLAAAEAMYGKTFNGALSLKALTFFAEGDLPTLNAATQSRLRILASQVDLELIVPSVGLQEIARKVVWFKRPEDTLKDAKLFLTHLMTYGTLREIRAALHYFSETDFDAVLKDPYPGIFDERSWIYWNLRYHHEPVPPLPMRRIPF